MQQLLTNPTVCTPGLA